MTAIVAVVHDGKVYMGADSASGGNGSIKTSTVEKVFVNGPFLIGYTWSWRMGQLLRYALKPPERDEHCTSAEQFMVTSFVDAVRQTLKDGGFARKENETEAGGQFLVGYEGHIFHIHSDYQVNEHMRGYDACGAGEEYALGVLHATEGLKPEERIRKALAAAEEFASGVRGPFVVKQH